VELRFRAHQGNELALKLYELYLRENADVSYAYTELLYAAQSFV
jgi:hypothetical protein